MQGSGYTGEQVCGSSSGHAGERVCQGTKEESLRKEMASLCVSNQGPLQVVQGGGGGVVEGEWGGMKAGARQGRGKVSSG